MRNQCKLLNLRLKIQTFPVFASKLCAGLVATVLFHPNRLWLHKIIADREADQLAETRETHFAHDVIPVAFDRAR